jgi:hypothetical protein
MASGERLVCTPAQPSAAFPSAAPLEDWTVAQQIPSDPSLCPPTCAGGGMAAVAVNSNSTQWTHEMDGHSRRQWPFGSLQTRSLALEKRVRDASLRCPLGHVQ